MPGPSRPGIVVLRPSPGARQRVPRPSRVATGGVQPSAHQRGRVGDQRAGQPLIDLRRVRRRAARPRAAPRAPEAGRAGARARAASRRSCPGWSAARDRRRSAAAAAVPARPAPCRPRRPDCRARAASGGRRARRAAADSGERANRSSSAMLPLTPGAVDQHQPQRHPVEVELGEALLGGELGAAIGVGRLRRRSPRSARASAARTALGADRRQKDEAPGAGALRRPRQPDRRLGVEHAVVVLRQARHGVREAGRMDHRIDVGERRRHVLRPRQVADHGARGRPSARCSDAAAARAAGSRAWASSRSRYWPMKPVAPVSAMSGLVASCEVITTASDIAPPDAATNWGRLCGGPVRPYRLFGLNAGCLDDRAVALDAVLHAARRTARACRRSPSCRCPRACRRTSGALSALTISLLRRVTISRGSAGGTEEAEPRRRLLERRDDLRHRGDVRQLGDSASARAPRGS